MNKYLWEDEHSVGAMNQLQLTIEKSFDDALAAYGDPCRSEFLTLQDKVKLSETWWVLKSTLDYKYGDFPGYDTWSEKITHDHTISLYIKMYKEDLNEALAKIL